MQAPDPLIPNLEFFEYKFEFAEILELEGHSAYWEYVEWICTYSENMQNARRVEYLGEFETKIKNDWGRLSGAWVRLAKPVKTQKSHESVPLRNRS